MQVRSKVVAKHSDPVSERDYPTHRANLEPCGLPYVNQSAPGWRLKGVSPCRTPASTHLPSQCS